MAFAWKDTRRYQLRVYIAVLFLALMLGFAALLLAGQYRQTRLMLLSASDTLFVHIAEQTRATINATYRPAVMSTRVLSQTDAGAMRTLGQRLTLLPLMAQALQTGQHISAIYIGYANGEFFLVRSLRPNSALARSVDAPVDAAFLVQSRASENGRLTGRYIFYDASLTQIADRARDDYLYDPRGRPWFEQARERSGLQVTAPYLFFTTHEVGATFAQHTRDAGAVAAVDVTLAAVSSTLADLQPTARAVLFVFNDRGEVMSTSTREFAVTVDAMDVPRLPHASDIKNPVMSALTAEPGHRDGKPHAILVHDEDWQTSVSRLTVDGDPLYLGIAAPQRELLAEADAMRNEGMLVALAAVLLVIPLTWWLSKLASRPLNALTDDTHRIRALNFENHPVNSFVLEIDELAQSMAHMKTTIRKFLAIGQALASERDLHKLLDRVLCEAKALTQARGGVIYLVEPNKSLLPIVARLGDTLVVPPPTPIYPELDAEHPAVRAVRRGPLFVRGPEARVRQWYPNLSFEGDRDLITVPLRTRGGEALGVLMMGYDVGTFAGIAPDDAISLLEAVAGPAAAAIDTQRLIQEQKALLESFIQLVAGAIDAKSPYTGGHCQRVPELAKMLAHAAEDATEGVFKDYRLTAEQWEELHIAAWLHDCGKVTTPEYVVDKATKLETLYDRLHEIRMRFEVLKREAEVACWRAIAEGAPRAVQLEQLRQAWAELDDEFAFVARCNEGGREFMPPEDVARLHAISRRMWTRTLDDRIGLSYEERERRAATPTVPLPAHEPLLADRPDHIIARPASERIAPDNPWGFKMAVPEHLYNRGELHNLTVSRGTLTSEERYKINEHIVETIRMLTKLPFPRHLSRVVNIAGSHHEKLDGTGYPRRLTSTQMGTRSRIMAIADIFEALTATDRPYKSGKPLSESIRIMARMRDERHIDSDLFELFLSSGVYLDYAHRYLPPEQIDHVDIGQYLSVTDTATE
ncbi:MAG: HD domain-containing phosphohydrolase [Rhodocyclaceae bacterium]